jgi:iron complex transport system permease protein
LAATGFFVSVAKGAVTMSVSQVVHILLEPGSDSLSQIIWNIRLPRSIVGALVGMNLALSGAILQAIMRNPLADPAYHRYFFRCRSGRYYGNDPVSLIWNIW